MQRIYTFHQGIREAADNVSGIKNTLRDLPTFEGREKLVSEVEKLLTHTCDLFDKGFAGNPMFEEKISINSVFWALILTLLITGFSTYSIGHRLGVHAEKIGDLEDAVFNGQTALIKSNEGGN